ncbi:MAG: aryl-sulfate sulfotransferase [Bacteroidetes bacterium]|nr:aryl-sulfate sulfotransferase [Bacteroidota bacterium]
MIRAFVSILLLFSISLCAQVIPRNGSNLIHSQIMFEYPAVKDASGYEIQISKWDSTKQVTIPCLRQADKTTATLVPWLDFGYEYRWTYQAFDKNGKAFFTSPEYKFYLKMPVEPRLDQQRVRLIPSNCVDTLKGLIALDYTKTVFDRKGRPVYYVPISPPLLPSGFFIRDLRISQGGTITLVTKFDAVEMDLEGHIIWIAPNDGKVSGEATEFYHHDFSRLDNGNYMVLSAKHKLMQAPNDTVHANVEFGTIIEYDQDGNVVWHWDSDKYFDTRDLFAHKLPDNKYDASTHSNSIKVSPDGKYIYLGFRDVSRVIKIEKVSGRVIESYGAKMPSGEARKANGFFRFQHSMIPLKDGNLAVFNNDSIADPKVTSSVLIFTDPKNEKTPSKILWKFDCKFDSLSNGKSLKMGNVMELPNHDLLVNMGTLNRTIELSRDKKILWDAFTEQWNAKVNKWEPFSTFRCNYVSSLYPCYFTAGIMDDGSGNTKKGNSSIQVFNEGTEADSYTIQVRSAGGQKELRTASVLPGESVSVNFDKPKAEGKYQVFIISSLDSRRTRTIDMPGNMQESTLNNLPQHFTYKQEKPIELR